VVSGGVVAAAVALAACSPSSSGTAVPTPSTAESVVVCDALAPGTYDVITPKPFRVNGTGSYVLLVRKTDEAPLCLDYETGPPVTLRRQVSTTIAETAGSLSLNVLCEETYVDGGAEETFVHVDVISGPAANVSGYVQVANESANAGGDLVNAPRPNACTMPALADLPDSLVEG